MTGLNTFLPLDLLDKNAAKSRTSISVKHIKATRWKQSDLLRASWINGSERKSKLNISQPFLRQFLFVVASDPSSAIAVLTRRRRLWRRRLQVWNLPARKRQNWSAHASHSRDALVKSQLQGKYHQRSQIYKQITAQDVILVDQRGLSSPSLYNAILPWPVGIGGRPFEI